MMEDEITVKAQRQFPNCEKYKKCCDKDKEFWSRVEEKPDEYRVPIKPKKVTIIYEKPPEGFEGW